MTDPTIFFVSGAIVGAVITTCVFLIASRKKKTQDDNIIFHIHHEY